MKKVLILCVLVINLLLMSQKRQWRTFSDMEDKLGTHFPIEIFKDKNGVNYSPDYLCGKTTLINLWSTTCAPCLREIPLLNELKKAAPNSNYMGITYDQSEKVNTFLTKHPFSFNHITDAGKQLQSYLIVQRYPMSLLIDKNGKITDVVGLITEEKLSSIEQILKN